MIALSPGLSWLIFGGWLLAVVLIVAFFMGATRLPKTGGDVLVSAPPAPSRKGRLDTFTEPADAHIRIVAGPYDHEARGDFE